MPITITYFIAGTTSYDEQGVVAGQSDIGLSEHGVEEAKKLGLSLVGQKFDVVFTSDLPRAKHTTNIAFGSHFEVKDEPRLREVDNGIYTGRPKSDMQEPQINYLDEPFPEGESFRDVQFRVQDLLNELKGAYYNKSVAFVSHFAPNLALDILLKENTWEEALKKDWHQAMSWLPGWVYILE